MNKKTKTTLQFILGGMLLTSFTIIGCNNGETKEVKTDTVTTEKSMEVAPAVMDTTIKKDTAGIRPTPGGPGN